MLFKTHVVFGLFLYLILFSYVESPWFFLLGVMVGSILVDIDSKNSKVGNYFLLRPLQFFMKHRGRIHSLFFGFIVMVVVAIFHAWLAFGFMVGFLGHLLLDSLTKQKIMLFWPLFKTKFGFSLVKSGGIIETIVFVVLLFIDLLLIVYHVALV